MKQLPILLAIVYIHGISGDQPLVITKSGAVLGNFQKTSDGTQINEFLGIPFAAPPIYKLRYEKPQPSTPWTLPVNATKYSKGCIPCVLYDPNQVDLYSEDCLYLNVWSPNLQGQLPVFFFIHGGAYETGEAGDYTAEAFRENFVRKGIVVVSIQYRLGQLGFLTLNDSVITPNLGLWDQAAALQWVQDNIGRFGGNSKRVTLYGQSAGSQSIAQLALSPKTQALFQQTIQMSGSTIGAAPRGLNTLEFSKNWTTRLGCDVQKKDYKSCLQALSVDQFWSVREDNAWGCGPSSLNYLGFAPIVDGDFLPNQPEELLKTMPKYPAMFGLNRVEARVFMLNSAGFDFEVVPSKWPSYNEDEFLKYVQKWITSIGYSTSDKQQVEQDILAYYKRNHSSSDAMYWLERYVETYSDWGMNVPVLREAIAKVQAGAPVYGFLLDYDNPSTWPQTYPCQGPSHSSEFPFTFGMGANFVYTDDDKAVEKYIQDAIVQFVKTGNPSTGRLPWDSFTLANHEYLSLKPKPEMKNDWFGDSYRFWTNYMHKYDYDWIVLGQWQQ